MLYVDMKFLKNVEGKNQEENITPKLWDKNKTGRPHLYVSDLEIG
jgi:hypothetical protein